MRRRWGEAASGWAVSSLNTHRSRGPAHVMAHLGAPRDTPSFSKLISISYLVTTFFLVGYRKRCLAPSRRKRGRKSHDV